MKSSLELSPPLQRSANISEITRRIPYSAQWQGYRIALLLVDVILLYGAFVLAYQIRFALNLSIFETTVTPTQAFYSQLFYILILVWLASFIAFGLYNTRNLLGGLDEYDLLARANTIGILVIIVMSFLDTELTIARGWLIMAWLLALLFTLFGRFSLRRAVYALRRHGYFLTPALIVGANEEAQSLARNLTHAHRSGMHVIGFVSDDNVERSRPLVGDLSVLGTREDLPQILERYNVSELIIATSALTRKEMLSYFQLYGTDADVNLRLSSGLFEIITTGLSINEVASAPLISVNQTRLTGLESIVKACLDYVITLTALIPLIPFFIFMAIAIRIDSKGPVIYRRRVMGLNGRQFDAFKFRTMHINGDEILEQHPELKAELAKNHKLKNDPRITRVGHLLRKTSLDELPQLFNVLRRDMSLIGPRMISPPEMEMYGHWGMNLLTVRPGITGLWQVSGRSDLDYKQRVQLDMQYIRNWNIWLDLYILLQTIPAVFKQRGAY